MAATNHKAIKPESRQSSREPPVTDIQQNPVKLQADENAEQALHARDWVEMRTPEIHEHEVQFNLACSAVSLENSV